MTKYHTYMKDNTNETHSDSLSKDSETSRHNFLGLNNNHQYLKNPHKSHATTFLNSIFGPEIQRKNEKKPIKMSKTTTTTINRVKSNNSLASTRPDNGAKIIIPIKIPIATKLNLNLQNSIFNMPSSNSPRSILNVPGSKNIVNTSLKLNSSKQVGIENMNLNLKGDKMHQPVQFLSQNLTMISRRKDF